MQAFRLFIFSEEHLSPNSNESHCWVSVIFTGWEMNVVDMLDQVWKFKTWPFFVSFTCTLQEQLLHFLSLPSCITCMGMVINNAHTL